MLENSNPIWEKCQRDSPLGELVFHQLQVWPEHEKFIRKSFESRSPSLMDSAHRTGKLIHQMISEKIPEHAESYRWMCGALNEEAMHFFRTGEYRHHSFVEVEREIYRDVAYMTRYMQGLLLSQIFWNNHANVIDYYIHDFVEKVTEPTRYLEIGPGHGLFCALASENQKMTVIEGWDVSPGSLEVARECLGKVGLLERVGLRIQDITSSSEDADEARFDRIVISEVLEHLEDPVAILKGIRRHLAPGGKVFINVPVNSPAPDHIFLLKTPEEARKLVEDGGFEVLDFKSFPITGYTEAIARKRSLTISCAMVAS